MPFRIPGHRDEPPPVSTSELEGVIRKKQRRMTIAVVGVALLFPAVVFGPHLLDVGFEWWRDRHALPNVPREDVGNFTPEEDARIAKIVADAKARRAKENDAFKAVWPKLVIADVPYGMLTNGVEHERCVSETERNIVILDGTNGALGGHIEDVTIGRPDAAIDDPRYANFDDAIVKEPVKAYVAATPSERVAAIDRMRSAVNPKPKNVLVVAIDSWKKDRAVARLFLWNTTSLRVGCAGSRVVTGSTPKAIIDSFYNADLAIVKELATRSETTPIEENTTFSDSDESDAPIVPQKSGDPVVVRRTHVPGQRYGVHLRHIVDGNELVFTGATTVLEADAKHAKFSVTTDQVKNPADALVLPSTQFDVTANLEEWSFDAKEIGTRKAGPLLTHIEVLLGDACRPPDDAHRVGEHWTGQDKTSWKMTAYDLQGGRAYASYTMDRRDERGNVFATKMRLAVDNGFVGSCTAKQNLALTPSLRSMVSWDLRVKRLPTTKLDPE